MFEGSKISSILSISPRFSMIDNLFKDFNPEKNLSCLASRSKNSRLFNYGRLIFYSKSLLNFVILLAEST